MNKVIRPNKLARSHSVDRNPVAASFHFAEGLSLFRENWFMGWLESQYIGVGFRVLISIASLSYLDISEYVEVG